MDTFQTKNREGDGLARHTAEALRELFGEDALPAAEILAAGPDRSIYLDAASILRS